MNRVLTTLAIALFALAMWSGIALAASPQTIINDWKNDGSIDGKYTVSELRAADAQIDASTREYYNWDDAYAAALARAQNKPVPPSTTHKPAPPGAKPHTGGGSSTASPDTGGKKTPTDATDTTTTTNDTEATAGSGKADKASDSDEGDDGSSGPIIAVLVVLALVAAVTVWRVMKTRKGPGSSDGDGDAGA